MAKKKATTKYRLTIRDAESWEIIYREVHDEDELPETLDAALGPDHGVNPERSISFVTTDAGQRRHVQISQPGLSGTR